MIDNEDPQHDARCEERRQRHEDDPDRGDRHWVTRDGVEIERPTRAEAETYES